MRNLRAPLILAAALGVAVLAGCGQEGGAGGLGPTPDPTYSINPDTPMNDLETVPPGDGDGGGADGNPGGGPQPPTGPSIEYFRVATEPTCPSGTDVNPIDGTPVTLEWKVRGADAASISIDGPGVYGTYEPEKSETFAFPCSGEPNTFQEHTYLLTTVGGDGEPRTKELTVSAKINEITVVTGPSAEAAP
jgi:hypothetical protein